MLPDLSLSLSEKSDINKSGKRSGILDLNNTNVAGTVVLLSILQLL